MRDMGAAVARSHELDILKAVEVLAIEACTN